MLTALKGRSAPVLESCGASDSSQRILKQSLSARSSSRGKFTTKYGYRWIADQEAELPAAQTTSLGGCMDNDEMNMTAEPMISLFAYHNNGYAAGRSQRRSME